MTLLTLNNPQLVPVPKRRANAPATLLETYQQWKSSIANFGPFPQRFKPSRPGHLSILEEIFCLHNEMCRVDRMLKTIRPRISGDDLQFVEIFFQGMEYLAHRRLESFDRQRRQVERRKARRVANGAKK